MAECQFIKRKELSKKPDQYQIPSSSMISQELEESESEVEIINSEPSDLKKVTSTGLQNPSPEKPEFSMSFITLLTTNSSELKLLSKTVSFKLMPLHSPNGI